MQSEPDLKVQPAPALTVYFDGACPVCSREIGMYRQSAGGEAIQWVDAARCDVAQWEALSPDLGRDAALARMHVRRADGKLVSGAAAFVAMWDHLPKFARLARIARVPGVVPLLELGYRGFLKARPLWRPASVTAWPKALARELRSDHAGETGAVMIYRGILAVSRDAEVRRFAEHHLATELEHLRLIEPHAPRSVLLPLWKLSGWLTGALPALFGASAVYATIEAVETFVDHHYAQQLVLIDQLDPSARDERLQTLRTLLQRCQMDEVAHRDDAASRLAQRPSSALALWTRMVGVGSAQAVKVCRYV